MEKNKALTVNAMRFASSCKSRNNRDKVICGASYVNVKVYATSDRIAKGAVPKCIMCHTARPEVLKEWKKNHKGKRKAVADKAVFNLNRRRKA